MWELAEPARPEGLCHLAITAHLKKRKSITDFRFAFGVLPYHRLHLRCAACQLFRGDRLYLAGLVQLLAGYGQHQLDAVFLVDAGRAGVVVHGGNVRVRVQGAESY